MIIHIVLHIDLTDYEVFVLFKYRLFKCTANKLEVMKIVKN